MRLITAGEVRKLLPMHVCINLVEKYFHEKHRVDFQTPQRIVSQIPEKDAVWLFMPAYSNKLQRLAVKIVNEYKRNPKLYNLPKALGILLLFDSEKGVPIALIDSVELTAIRTGALSGVATKYMARQNVEVVTLIGSGIQAWTQLEAVDTIRRISKVYVYSVTKANREEFAKKAAEVFDFEINAVDNPGVYAKESDLIIAATNSATPVLYGRWISEGVHVNSIGVLPNRRELEDDVIGRASKIVADVKDSVLREAGDIIHAIKNNVITRDKIIELEDLVVRGLGRRENEREVTLFKSVGFAAIDLYTASYVYSRSLESNIGRDVEFRTT